MWSQPLHRTQVGERQRPTGRRRLVITGTPGTGKRALGNYLAEERGFVHLDLDRGSTRAQFLRSGEEGLRAELAALAASNRKLVVTWTFASETQLAYVEVMQSLGFEWIWTDSDRGAGYDALLEHAATTHKPRFVDAFESDGSFRSLEAMTGELRRRRPVQLPRPTSVRVPAVSVVRPVWAGVAAFTVAAAVVGGAYIGGVFTLGQPARVPVAHYSQSGIFPVNGVLVRGKSLGGVFLGESASDVRVAWGNDYTVLSDKPTTWLYWSPTGDPYGAAVSLRGGYVTAIYTLGGIEGWRTNDGLSPGQTLATFNNQGPGTTQTACIGYGAVSTRSGSAVTSILMQGQAIYGFALTRPSEPVCH
jgi:hypothetical protein